MNIELLNVRIYIQKNEVISDAIGNRRNVWKDYYTCYATVSAEAGKESTDAGEIIMIHEEKDTDADLSLECRIVMDADLLDEVGAVSVLWDSMATALEDDASYKRAYYRIKNFYRINKPKIRRCKTDAGRVEYNKRMQLLEEFIFQLEKELF